MISEQKMFWKGIRKCSGLCIPIGIMLGVCTLPHPVGIFVGAAVGIFGAFGLHDFDEPADENS